MTRKEAITVLEAFMENPLFSDEHKAAFNIAIHDVKAYQNWNINNLILINKDNYEPLEQEPKTGYREYNDIYDHYLCGNCKTVVMDYDNYCPNCGCRMVEPQESEG